MTKNEVMQKLKHLPDLESVIVASPRVQVKNGELVYYRGQLEYKIGPQALLSAARITHIPEEYAKKCPAELIVPHVNYYMEKLGKCRMVTSDGEVVAFVEPSSVPMSTERVLETITKVMPGADFERVYERGQDVELYAVGVKQMAVKVGDVVAEGVYVRFSPMGLNPPLVKAYLIRLICTNGVISTEDVFKFDYHDGGDKVWKWLRRSVQQAAKGIRKQVGHLKEMQNVRLTGHASQVLADIYRQARLPAPVRQAITARALGEGVSTLYDVFDIITRIASHDVHDPGLVHRLMATGGEIAQHKSRCPTCHRILEWQGTRV